MCSTYDEVRLYLREKWLPRLRGFVGVVSYTIVGIGWYVRMGDMDVVVRITECCDDRRPRVIVLKLSAGSDL